jgi:hypothetical protein
MIPLYFNELATILNACTQLRPDECSPKDLRHLMASHLAHVDVSLAEKVERFDAVQMLALSAFIFQAQALVGMSSKAP